MQKILIVIAGSGLGGAARYLIGGWAIAKLGPGFPYATIGINALGSFLVMVIMHVGLRTELIGPDLRLALTTGLMGGFTTYSTFNYETISFLESGAVLLALANFGITAVACLLAGGAGLWVGRLMVGT